MHHRTVQFRGSNDIRYVIRLAGAYVAVYSLVPGKIAAIQTAPMPTLLAVAYIHLMTIFVVAFFVIYSWKFAESMLEHRLIFHIWYESVW